MHVTKISQYYCNRKLSIVTFVVNFLSEINNRYICLGQRINFSLHLKSPESGKFFNYVPRSCQVESPDFLACRNNLIWGKLKAMRAKVPQLHANGILDAARAMRPVRCASSHRVDYTGDAANPIFLVVDQFQCVIGL